MPLSMPDRMVLSISSGCRPADSAALRRAASTSARSRYPPPINVPRLKAALFSVSLRLPSTAPQTGVAILIVEQKVREVLNVAHRVYSLKLGRVAFSGQASELRDNKGQLRELFL